MPLLTDIAGLIPFFTDKGQAQVDSFTNAGTLIKRDARTLMTVKSTYEFAGTEAADDLIGIIQLKDGADINWHNIEILVDDDADTFTCTLGVMDSDGTFTPKATMGAATDNVSAAVVPGPDEELLTETKWIAAKISVAPGVGKATFYVPYIALA